MACIDGSKDGRAIAGTGVCVPTISIADDVAGLFVVVIGDVGSGITSVGSPMLMQTALFKHGFGAQTSANDVAVTVVVVVLGNVTDVVVRVIVVAVDVGCCGKYNANSSRYRSVTHLIKASRLLYRASASRSVRRLSTPITFSFPARRYSTIGRLLCVSCNGTIATSSASLIAELSKENCMSMKAKSNGSKARKTNDRTSQVAPSNATAQAHSKDVRMAAVSIGIVVASATVFVADNGNGSNVGDAASGDNEGTGVIVADTWPGNKVGDGSKVESGTVSAASGIVAASVLAVGNGGNTITVHRPLFPHGFDG